MALALACDPVALYPPGGEDSHGWALPGTDPVAGAELAPEAVWEGIGNLQPQASMSNAGADAGGGHGPFDPASGAVASLMLPPDAPLADGMVAVIDGTPYALSQCRKMRDPRCDGDGLTCWQATATGMQWGPDNGP